MAPIVLRKQRQLIVTNWDRYTLTSGLFLVLSLLSWLLARNLPSRPTQSALGQEKWWSAQCWFPAQFNPHHVQFGKTICEKALNQELHLSPSSGSVSMVQVGIQSLEDENRRFPGFVSVSEALAQRTGTVKRTLNEKDAEKDGVRLQHLMGTKTPVLFFIIAILCIVPHILWTSANACMPLNITATLFSTKELEFESWLRRQEVTPGLGRALAPAASGRHNSIILFSTKAVSCLCVVIGIALTASGLTGNILPISANVYLRQKLRNADIEAMEEVSLILREPFACFFRVAVFYEDSHNIHDYTVQCIAEQLEHSGLRMTASSHREADSEILLQNLCFSLYIAVMSYLALFLLAELSSLVFWVWRLVVVPDCPSSKSSPRHLSLDARLLLLLVTSEAGPLVCQDLERALLSEGKEGSEDEDVERMIEEGEEGADAGTERLEEKACKEVPE